MKPEVITPTKDLVKAYAEATAIINKLQEELDPLKKAQAEIKAQITAQLKESGQLSARFEEGTATMSIRKTAKVVDQAATISHLKALKMDNYIEETLNADFDAVLSRIKETGETMPGVEIIKTEYLTIKSPKKELPIEQLKEIS